MDDHVDLANSMALALRHDGHVTATAFNGHQAINVARAFLPHAVILDIDLPDCSGYEVARALRIELHLDQMIIVAISGRERDTDIPTELASMINTYMLKPFDIDDLFRSLRHNTRTRRDATDD